MADYRVGDIIEYQPPAWHGTEHRHGFAIIIHNPIKGHPRNWPVEWIMPPVQDGCTGTNAYVREVGVLDINILRVVGHCED